MLKPPLLEFHTLVGDQVYDVASFELSFRRLFGSGSGHGNLLGQGGCSSEFLT